MLATLSAHLHVSLPWEDFPNSAQALSGLCSAPSSSGKYNSQQNHTKRLNHCFGAFRSLLSCLGSLSPSAWAQPPSHQQIPIPIVTFLPTHSLWCGCGEEEPAVRLLHPPCKWCPDPHPQMSKVSPLQVSSVLPTRIFTAYLGGHITCNFLFFPLSLQPSLCVFEDLKQHPVKQPNYNVLYMTNRISHREQLPNTTTGSDAVTQNITCFLRNNWCIPRKSGPFLAVYSKEVLI